MVSHPLRGACHQPVMVALAPQCNSMHQDAIRHRRCSNLSRSFPRDTCLGRSGALIALPLLTVVVCRLSPNYNYDGSESVYKIAYGTRIEIRRVPPLDRQRCRLAFGHTAAASLGVPRRAGARTGAGSGGRLMQLFDDLAGASSVDCCAYDRCGALTGPA